MASAKDLGSYFCVPPELRDLTYGNYIDVGEENISKANDYNSHNTNRLDLKNMQKLLMKLDLIRRAIT